MQPSMYWVIFFSHEFLFLSDQGKIICQRISRSGVEDNEGKRGRGRVRVPYLRALKSLGAAHAVAQWVRWKTARDKYISVRIQINP